VSDQALVTNAIASALGVSENLAELLLNTLKRLLARQQILLIDNFEQVIEAAPLVSELLAACPRLKVLVTSRESLHISGEQEYQVALLSLPDEDVQPLEQLAASEAGALFIQRAKMTQPHFEVRVDNAVTIAQICHRLDGLPLAIELAAARIKLLTPKTLLERMQGKDNSPLRALAGGVRDAPLRQRTLRDSIEWSYDLLNESDRMLFARLAVFRGGCPLEAIRVDL
jgi:predicted ATPase